MNGGLVMGCLMFLLSWLISAGVIHFIFVEFLHLNDIFFSAAMGFVAAICVTIAGADYDEYGGGFSP
jgi:hypothetical protein